MLCVPLGAKYRYKNIGFTTDIEIKTKKQLRAVLEIAEKLNAKVKCLYVKSSTSEPSGTIGLWEKNSARNPSRLTS
jgi:hypothetical protein